ncbi:hypothetical protein [Streptomyces sp. SID3343]|uniref:hypothetical protein n=1 Tax=Streptomyces sp. SID3343 TaxID=2690260 RepID=UPI001368604F|nr:hypothetical protein [Streptomyces sp. SID3343]MYV97488.1 hypothetical protein [Streptomyces sp. SID3343]
MIKRIALVVLAGVALSVAFAVIASAEPTPDPGEITGTPGDPYPDGANELTRFDGAADMLPL